MRAVSEINDVTLSKWMLMMMCSGRSCRISSADVGIATTNARAVSMSPQRILSAAPLHLGLKPKWRTARVKFLL